DEAEHHASLEAEPGFQVDIRFGIGTEARRVDGVRNHRNALLRNPARDDVVLEAVADRCDMIRAAHRPRFQSARKPVAETPLAVGAMVDCGILLESPDFINDRDAHPAAYA